MIMWWYDDVMIWWYDDMMIRWYDDMMIWWYDDMMIWGMGRHEVAWKSLSVVQCPRLNCLWGNKWVAATSYLLQFGLLEILIGWECRCFQWEVDTTEHSTKVRKVVWSRTGKNLRIFPKSYCGQLNIHNGASEYLINVPYLCLTQCLSNLVCAYLFSLKQS